jgi:hypothetical protein
MQIVETFSGLERHLNHLKKDLVGSVTTCLQQRRFALGRGIWWMNGQFGFVGSVSW